MEKMRSELNKELANTRQLNSKIEKLNLDLKKTQGMSSSIIDLEAVGTCA